MNGEEQTVQLKESLRDPFLSALLGLALLLRMAAVPIIHQLGYTSDEREYLMLGERIIQGEGFTDSNGTRSVRAPLYPAVLGALVALERGGTALAHVVGAVMGAGSVWLVFLLSMEVFRSRPAALWGAGIAAGVPGLVIYAAMLQTETMYILLFLASLLVAIRLARRPSLLLAASLGFLGGLSALTRAVYLPFFPALLLVLWIGGLRRGWRTTVYPLLAALCFLAVLTPWTVRNYTIHHRLIPVSTFAGTSLLLGNNPYATGTLREAYGFDEWFADQVDRKTGHLPEELSEVQLEDASREIATDYILSHPVKFAGLLLKKADVLLFYPITNTDSYVPLQLTAVSADLLVLLAASLGWIATSPRRGAFAGLIAVILFFFAIHIVLHADARFRLPLTPLLSIFAGAGMAVNASRQWWRYLLRSRRKLFGLIMLWAGIFASYGVNAWLFLTGRIS